MTTELTYDDVFFNEYVALSYRTDKWQFPGAVLKARLREAEAAFLEKKGQTKLSRAQKSELKLLVAKRMKRSQQMSHGVQAAAHAVKSGDSHGGGSSVNLSESD